MVHVKELSKELAEIMGEIDEMETIQLASEIECTGCTACYSVCPNNCIKMNGDSFGFPRPVIDKAQCVKCGLCQNACPVVQKRSFTTIDGIRTYAAYSKDENIRYTSSSGGIFSEIAISVLDQGGVIWGAAYDASFAVRHIAVESRDELHKLQGAKYSQSELGDAFSQIKQQLIRGRQVLFCGSPCQVYGLKGFLTKEYDNLICVDFVCHSIPSPYAWKKYLDYRSKSDSPGEHPSSINMRSKITGWSHYGYSVLIDYEHEKYMARSNQDLYMKLFVGGYISRSSCANCKFKGFERASDLTIGDCWGVWNFAPQMDDDKGTSLVIVHTEKGKEFFLGISDRINTLPISKKEALESNKAISNSQKVSADRNKSLKMAVTGKYTLLEQMLKNKSRVKTAKDTIKKALTVLNKGRTNYE